MYASYFGLKRRPFSLAPDPRFLYLSERHREALAHLLYGTGGSGGFVLLTGEIGAGKTTVTRCFLEQLPAHCVVAYIFNPCLSVIELLQTIVSEFGIVALPPQASVKAHVDALNDFLLRSHAQGKHALLVIDEAQALDPPVLEQLRLLTNLETAERKLLQIVLIGQPELRTQLAQPGLEQLAQRVIARYHLGALSAPETRLYVEHRLAVAGLKGPSPFDAAALTALHRASGGVPRRINLLADRALLGAYSQSRRGVDKATVLKAAAEVFDTAAARAPARRALALAAAALAATALVAAGLWLLPQAKSPAVAQAASAPSSVASAASAAAAAAPAASDDPAALLQAALADEATGWRELALRWNVSIGEGDPCIAALKASLACYRATQGGLPLARQLARPALLALRDDRGRRSHALLVALDEQQATLQVGDKSFRLTLPALARVWRGEMATFWRTPPGWRNGPGGDATPELRRWVQQQLAASMPGLKTDGVAQRVAAFQVWQGLPADGQAGPLTLMMINRQAGVTEPGLNLPLDR